MLDGVTPSLKQHAIELKFAASVYVTLIELRHVGRQLFLMCALTSSQALCVTQQDLAGVVSGIAKTNKQKRSVFLFILGRESP